MRAPPPPRALGHAAAALRPFRARGRMQLAVIVKTTFHMAHKRAMSPLRPVPVLGADVCSSADPRAPISAAGEMAPYLPRADILLTGSACARGGEPAQLVPVRLRVGLGANVLLDKTLHVYGDRAGNGRGAPQPFLVLPLGYERALGGAADPDNPAGADPRAGGVPNIIDPRQPARAAGFGPVAAHWPARRRLLGDADPRAVLSPWPTVPDGFDWSYFQAAPPDQQTPCLQGQEWMVLEGFHPELPRVEAWLPGAVAEAQILLPGAREPQPLPLFADMLVINADRWVCSVVWRASASLPGDDALASARVTVRVVLPGEDVAWDEAPRARPSRAEAPVPQPPPRSVEAPASQQPPLAVEAPPRAALRAPVPDVSAGEPSPVAPRRKAPAVTMAMSAFPEMPLAPALPFIEAAVPASSVLPFAAPAAPVLPFAAPKSSALPFATPADPALPFVVPPASRPVSAHVSSEPLSPWASGASQAPPSATSLPFIATSPVSSPSFVVAPPVTSAAPRPSRARRPRLLPGERPTSAPLVPPRKRRPAKVAADGLGASFLDSAKASASVHS